MIALITDGNERPALAIARSLGRRGVSVVIGEETPESLAASSRYCSRHVVYPSPYREPEAFRQFIADFVRREKPDVLFPVTDVTTHLLARSQQALRPDTAMALPSFEAFEAVTDKSNVLALAGRCGIPVPRTHLVQGMDGLPRVLPEVSFPAVVKPVRSRIPTSRGWVSAGVHYAESASDLRRVYERTDYLAAHPSLIQERIVGTGVGVFVLFDRGELLGAFAHRRLREKPPSGGLSVLCESIPVDPQLRSDAVRLLGPLGWHGVAMLEYKQDRRTGHFFLMEVNGRFWGSLQLAVDAGIDFPYLACQLARGHRPEVPRSYRAGVKNRWLAGDLDHLLARLFHSRRSLRLAESAPSRGRALVDFLTCGVPGRHDQVISSDDPRPFVHEMRGYARSLAVSAALRAQMRRAGGRVRASRLARTSFPM